MGGLVWESEVSEGGKGGLGGGWTRFKERGAAGRRTEGWAAGGGEKKGAERRGR